MKLDGKVALIAGGSGALGQKVALGFAQAGARVIIVDRDTPSVQGKGRLAIKADVTNEAEVQTLVSDVVREAGRIDVLINLVGGFATGRVAEPCGVDSGTFPGSRGHRRDDEWRPALHHGYTRQPGEHARCRSNEVGQARVGRQAFDFPVV